MRKPNYKVFIYDHTGRFVEQLKLWAINAASAYKKADAHLVSRKKDPNFYTCVAREIGQ